MSKKRSVSGIALAALTVALVSVIVVYELKRRPPPIEAGAIEARIELAAGDVRVVNGDAEQRVHGPKALRVGSKVIAGEGARVMLRLPDGSSAFLRGGTEVELGHDALSLHRGEYWLDAPTGGRRGLVHRAGDVGVTAEDAGLSLGKSDGAVSVYVARGMAVVTGKAGRVEVHAGELADVAADGVPAVEPLAFWDDWTGGMADFGATVAAVAAGSGEILGVDSGSASGTPADRLQLNSQSVRAVIRDGLAETEVDQTFFNPAPRPVEGWYWFAVPEGAIVTSFAVETNGQLVEGEFVERREAATKYTGAKSAGHAPAILEWIDSQTYRARIYPIMPAQTRRVVLRYLELLPTGDGKLAYLYPMASRSALRIGEFSLSIDLGSEGKAMDIATLAEARIEDGGQRVTMRRSGYTPRVDFQLEAKLPERSRGVRISRFSSGGDAADYVMARYVPDVDWDSAKPPRGDVVLVVDTSAGADEATRRLSSTVAESILRALSKEDRFALVALDVAPRVLHPKAGLVAADDEHIARALEALSGHAAGGATDLAALFDVALGRVHDAAQPAVVYVGDGLATSGEQTGEALIERLRRAIGTSRARLFTVAVGPDADTSLLSELARAGGGKSLSVHEAAFATATALQLAAAFKVPTLTDFELDLGAGLDEPMSNVSGKLVRGDEVVMLARTHHDLPKKVAMRGRLGETVIERELELSDGASVLNAFVPKLWAAAHVRRLLGASVALASADGSVSATTTQDSGRITALGVDYGLMTPYTSILALESEAAYSNMGIERRRGPLRGVKLTSLDTAAEWRLVEGLRHREPAAGVMGCSKDEVSASPPEPLHRDGKAQPATAPPARQRVESETLTEGQDIPAAQEQAGEARAPDGMLFGMAGGVGGNTWAADIKGGLDRARWQRSALGTCSALARRPLAQRALVWAKRLLTAAGPEELIERYAAAQRACEINDWRAEQMLLDLLQRHIDSEAGARLLLGAFDQRRDVQQFVAKLILRRVVDERMVAAVEQVLFGVGVDWNDAERRLSEIEDVDERIAKLRELMARAPDDPNGIIRLVEMLATAGRVDEALAVGRRLRDRGLMTVRVVRQLGDVLARAGQHEEAVRTYSEIVEFDASSAESRQLLGDIYLARGWFDPAYRQYRTLADAQGDALAWLRLATAAAGAGRVDEALRIDKQVASAQGRPGPDDPRRWARIWSAARVARLIAAPPEGTSSEALQRKLKELQLFQGEGTLVIVTWPDLTSDVALTTTVDDAETALGETTDAAPVGLAATLLSRAEWERAMLVARLRSVPRKEPLRLERHDITWDGKAFAVSVRSAELPAQSTRLAL